MTLNPVEYTSRDYAAFRSDMLRLAGERLPEWTTQSPGDPEMVFIEAFAYLADNLSFYIDRVANEAFLATAVRRSSVLNIARMLGYRPTNPVAAEVELQFTKMEPTVEAMVPASTKVSTVPTDGSDPVYFETNEDLIIPVGVQSALVWATEGETQKDELLGVSTGDANQRFTLFMSPMIEDSLQIFVDEGFGPTEWIFFENILDAGSNSSAYTMLIDEYDVATVFLGDNASGRIPATGAAITATYRVGGGDRGNVGANTIVQLEESIPDVLSVTNPIRAIGGDDKEELDSIRDNAPRSLSALSRAVTLEDYAALALRVNGVAKAKAVAAVYTSVTIYIAPFGGGSITPALESRVHEYLQPRKIVTTSITLAEPTYVGVDILVLIEVLPHFGRNIIRQEVLRELRQLLHFDNVDIGKRITISSLYRAISSIVGVDYSVVTKLARSGNEDVQDLLMNDNEIPQEGVVDVIASGGIIGS